RPYLHSAGLNRLDGLLLTHGDSAHIGGAAALVRDFPRLRLIDSPLRDRSSVHQRLRQLVHERGIEAEQFVSGKQFQISPNVTAMILHPPPDLAAAKADDQSCVIRLSIGNSGSILF